MLLQRVEQHIKLTRTPPTRFGRESVGDPRFVFDLRAGREPRSKTVDRVLTYLDRAERRVR
jgi:hypothetical protein